jgi:hypothetical protein
MLGIEVKYFTIRGLFVVVLKWAVRFGESRDCGIVGRWAEEQLRSYLSVIRFGADSRWSGLQRQPNSVVSAVGGISYSSFTPQEGPWRGALNNAKSWAEKCSQPEDEEALMRAQVQPASSLLGSEARLRGRQDGEHRAEHRSIDMMICWIPKPQGRSSIVDKIHIPETLGALLVVWRVPSGHGCCSRLVARPWPSTIESLLHIATVPCSRQPESRASSVWQVIRGDVKASESRMLA